MIWYDVLSGAPIAPGSGEDGDPPSMEVYFCYHCAQARFLKADDDLMVCATCGTALLSLH